MPHKYTLDYIKSNKIAINCTTAEEAERVCAITKLFYSPIPKAQFSGIGVNILFDGEKWTIWHTSPARSYDYVIILAAEFLKYWETQQSSPPNLIPFDIAKFNTGKYKAVYRDGSEPLEVVVLKVDRKFNVISICDTDDLIDHKNTGSVYNDDQEFRFDLFLISPEPTVTKEYVVIRISTNFGGYYNTGSVNTLEDAKSMDVLNPICIICFTTTDGVVKSEIVHHYNTAI